MLSCATPPRPSCAGELRDVAEAAPDSAISPRLIPRNRGRVPPWNRCRTLPPKVPEELAELDRALQLLGAVCQAGRIKDKHRRELETLLGGQVSQQLAAHWKKHLKEIRHDLAEELKRDPEGEEL